MLIEIDLHQQADEVRRFMHEHAGALRPSYDLFGDQPAPLGDDYWRGVPMRIEVVKTPEGSTIYLT